MEIVFVLGSFLFFESAKNSYGEGSFSLVLSFGQAKEKNALKGLIAVAFSAMGKSKELK